MRLGIDYQKPLDPPPLLPLPDGYRHMHLNDGPNDTGPMITLVVHVCPELMRLLPQHRRGLGREARLGFYYVDQSGKPVYGPVRVYTHKGYLNFAQRAPEVIG